MYLDFILDHFWILLAIISVLAIVIGFGKGIWQYCIKPLFKHEQRKDITDLDWSVSKRRSIWIGHMFFK